MDTDEEELIARAKAGDALAWTAFYDRHYFQLYRYVYSRLRSREEAEDVASQVFVEAIRGIDKFSYRGKPLLAWLYRIASNLVGQSVKQYRRQKAYLERFRLTDDSASTAGCESRLETYDLLDAVSRLTKEQREVIILRFFVSLPMKEVAHVLDKKEAAVFSLQVRGVKSLRRMLSSNPHLLEELTI